jgi:hypothetical protein
MSFSNNLFERLDEERFLGLQVWEFASRSLSQEYGRAFLRKVVLRHPWRTLKGIFEYRRFLKGGRREGGMTHLFWGREEDLFDQATAGESVLVGLGFCQKPFECPSRRPNHSCLYLSRLDLDQGEEWPHPICRGCKVAIMGKKALAAGASMYMMTSALDIAHDLMIPAIEEGRFKKVILCLCPFSVRAITLPLLICGIRGYLIEYSSGNCRNHQQWLLADRGIKGQMTTLGPEAYEKILSLLDLWALRCSPYGGFQREGNIYRPVR